MYNFGFCSSFFNKIVVSLITISLLSVSFSFNFDKNIEQEFNTLYKATSVCEYYNTITNFSYGIINKILKSANMISTDVVSSQKSNEEKKDTKNNNPSDLYFVQLTNEKEANHIMNFSNFSSFYSLLNSNICFNLLLNKIFFKFHIFELSCIQTFFHYFARGNIEGNILINNLLIENRLV